MVAGELKHAERNLPRVIHISMALVLVRSVELLRLRQWADLGS